MNKNIYSLTMLGVAASMALTSCQNDDLMQQNGDRAVRMSVGIEFDAEQTRSILKEEDGSLKCYWEEGDVVWVVGEEGQKYGELTIVDGIGETFAHFDGTLVGLDNGKTAVNFIYFGRGVKAEEVENTNNQFVYDFSSQAGTLASLSEMDYLCSQRDITVDGDFAYTEDMGLARHNSFAHFELKFPEGVTRTNETVTVSGAAVYNTIKYNKKTTGTTFSGGDITVAGSGNDLYMTIIPGSGVTPTFTVTIGGKTYTGSLAARNWRSSEFVRKSHGVGVPVEMTTSSEVVDHSKNPLAKWAEGNLQRSGSGLSVTGTIASSYTTTGSYYQFGRNYGFNSVSEAAQNYGAERSDIASNRNIYAGTGSTAPISTYYASTINFSNYPNYFFIASAFNGDYTTPDHQDTWTQRAAKMGYSNSTPCPSGWRLPTVAEFKEILPVINGKAGNTGSSAWSALVQIKTLDDGSKCAFRWSKTTSGSYSYLKIEALMVDDKTTTTTVDWTDSNVQTRYFKGAGYIQAHRNLWQFTSSGVSSTHYTARPLEWGQYQGQVQSNGTVVVSLTQSLMNMGGFYWTSDAVQGAFSIVFNSSTGYTLGYYLSSYADPIGANIRCVRAD